MADLLKVTTPITPKAYEYANKSQQPNSDQIFNLGDTSKVQKTTERTEEYAEQDLKDQEGQSLPKLEVAISKSPAMSATILRALIGTDAMEVLRSSADAELLNKVTEFASEIMLKPEELLRDMLQQENQTTIFKGELWDALKSILSQSGIVPNEANLKLLLELEKAGILKNPASGGASLSKEMNMVMQNSPDSQNSVQTGAAGFMFNGAAASGKLGGMQMADLGLPTATNIAEAIKLSAAGMNAAELTDSIMDFMKATINSYSRDDILKSISTNLTYLANEVAPSKELANGLVSVANTLTPENFNSMKNTILTLLNYTENSLILSDQTKNLIPMIVYNMSRFNGSQTAMGESFNALVNMTGNNTQLANKLNELFVKFVEKSDLPPDIKLASLKTSESAAAQRSMMLLTERVATDVQKGIEEVSKQDFSNRLSLINTSEGTESLKNIFTPLISSNMGGALNTLLRNFESTKDLNTLIDRLGIIVNNVENLDKKIVLAQTLNEVLGNLSEKEGINYTPPTSMENMFNFLAKNIDNPSLKSLSSIDKGEMVQGLLTSPGVYTPLIHHLLPVNMDGFKAFGELWIDPNAEQPNGKKGGSEKNCQHLFLCFDVENMGYFELEIYSNQRDINVLLLCPSGMEKTFYPLKETIPIIAESSGYHISNAAIGSLSKRRDLSNVFPKIRKQRSGLNVKI